MRDDDLFRDAHRLNQYGEDLRNRLNEYTKMRVSHRITISRFTDCIIVAVAALPPSAEVWPVTVFTLPINAEPPVNHAEGGTDFLVWEDSGVVKIRRRVIEWVDAEASKNDADEVICFVLENRPALSGIFGETK